MSDKILPAAAMEKILKKAGALRVSDDAKEELRVILEEIASDISNQAIRAAKHAGRKTIKASDIKMASR
ncbi:NFYB/HAP3 family transcription factor subunit [Candidatus Woesearchaeota archaeon]|nr:hypothetical protein [uncultured archaeon]MBS3167305.1 NFYB/HAP3 family transcription factor subunit [Candidatus Woesearchaeota archaeon]